MSKYTPQPSKTPVMKSSVAPSQSSSRKSPLQSSIRLFPKSAASSNIDFIVSAAGGIKSLSMIVDKLAKQVSTESKNARDVIAAVSADFSAQPKSSKPQTNENDVSQEQDRIFTILKDSIPKTNSTVLDSNILKTAENLIKQSRQQFVPLRKVTMLNVENKITPDLDSVSLEMKKGKGTTDSFFSHLTFSIPVSDVDSGNITSIRIFRSTVANPNFYRPLSEMSLRGIGTISSRPLSSRSKSDDSISKIETRLRDDGVPNELTYFNPVDRFTNERVAVATSTRFGDADKSVAENPQFLNARRLQQPDFGLYQPEEVITAGSISDGQDMGTSQSGSMSSDASKFNMVVQKGNASKFVQIYSGKPDGFSSKKIGKRYYFTCDDESITFGRQYSYYVVTVDKNMVQSNRSVIVSVNVDGLRVPAAPSDVFITSDGKTITLLATTSDKFVEKFEVWKRDWQESVSKKEFFVVKSKNGFAFVDEIINTDDGGANWTDKKVVPGHSYSYRIFSVDIFGNKSERPFEVKTIVPDFFNGDDKSLTRPSILAEVDSKTQKIILTLRCQDSNVKKLRLERRDLTIGQEAYTVPSDSSRIIMGNQSFKHGSYVHGEKISDQDNISMWNGWIENNPSGTISFVDKLTTFDRTYQYRVHGTDALGNRTSYDYSSPVLVYRKPMINSPVNLSSSFVTGTSGNIVGVNLIWQSSSIDISSEDKMGSQNKLADTAVRTLYQLERQKQGDEWMAFSMTENSSFFDPVQGFSGTIAPDFRPPYLELGQQYNYRVQSVMSGGFISNKTNVISVYVSNEVLPPINFSVRTPDPRLRPFYVMLNWDTDDRSGVIDHWIIDRVEVNNLAAARINLKNPSDFQKLMFQEYRTVYAESSRFSSLWSDVLYSGDRSSLMTGRHHFMDSKITFGNTYFYRLIAVNSIGTRSSPVYRGIKATYSSYERMAEEVYSASEKTNLTNNFVPVRLVPAIMPEPPKDSMSYNPTFSTPGTQPKLKQASRTDPSKPGNY